MENASKALLIAGGILVGMIVISLFYYMFGKVSMLVSDTDRNTLEEEIIAYNKGFEAYNKKIMYGIDVINALNKAMDNNKRNKCENDSSSEFYVDIEIRLTEDFADYVETYEFSESEHRYVKKNAGHHPYNSSMDSKTYTLSNNSDRKKLKAVLIDGVTYTDEDEGLVYTGGATEDTRLTDPPNYEPGDTYKITYHAAADFKRRAFKCAKIMYDNVSGRVKKMIFQQTG